MKKSIIKLFIIIFILIPCISFAQENERQDVFYRAKVIEILKEQKTVLPDGNIVEQQNLKLIGLEGDIKDKEIEFNGIGGYDAVNKNIYKVGEKILIIESQDFEGNIEYYITDYVRSGSLWWLVIIFVLILLLIGRWKGFRSIIALVFTFLVIIKYIIPKILSGSNPITVTIIGSFVILLLIIYITEGFGTRSHIAIVSIFFSLIITIFLSWFFVGLAKLSGLASEEISYLVELVGGSINFKGLLLAGVIIGVLGVLDDVVIAQVATTEQIHKTDHSLSKSGLFKKSYDVGVSHISSMTNTLFLAYAGVSMPLLILFISGQSAFTKWGQIINNEVIATEIVRTLAGSIGLIMAVPISTFVAVWWLKARNTKHATQNKE